MNTKEQLKNYLANYFTQVFAYLDSGVWKEPVGAAMANTLHSLFKFCLVPMGAAVVYLALFIIDFLISSIPSMQFKFKELLDMGSEAVDYTMRYSDIFKNDAITEPSDKPKSIDPELYERMQQLNCPNPNKAELSDMFSQLLDLNVIKRSPNSYKGQKEVLSKLLDSELLDVAPF